MIHTTIEPEEEELAYLDNSFNDVFINFVEIKAVCSKCHLLFLSKLKLHIHLKSGCVGEVLPSASFQLFSSIPIIVSKAMHASLELGVRFRGWIDTIAAITLAPKHLP